MVAVRTETDRLYTNTIAELVEVIQHTKDRHLIHTMGCKQLIFVLASLLQPPYLDSEKHSLELLVGTIVLILAWQDQFNYENPNDGQPDFDREKAPPLNHVFISRYYPPDRFLNFGFDFLKDDPQALRIRKIGRNALKSPSLFNHELLVADTTNELFPALGAIADKVERLISHYRNTDDELYVRLYNQQLKQRRTRTIIVIIAAILFPPSLIISLPLWFRAKRNETIQKIETTADVIRDVRNNREAYWSRTGESTRIIKEFKDKKRIALDKLRLVSEQKPRKVKVTGKGANVTIYLDMRAAERFRWFKNSDVKKLTIEQIEASKLQSRELIAAALSVRNTV